MPEGLDAKQTREWAIQLSRQIDRERAAAAATGDVQLGATVPDVIKSYLTTIARTKRPETTKSYTLSLAYLERWAAQAQIGSTDVLTPRHLAGFHDWLVSQPQRTAVAAGKRGERAAAEPSRSPVSVNHDLRAVRTFIEWARDRGYVPRLVDDRKIRKALERLEEDRDPPNPLRSNEIRRLLQAGIDHDAETFELTRDGRRDVPKYTPIAPLLAFALLSGCRRGEILKVDRSDIDVTAGEIRIRAEITKTKKGRVVDLSVSPGLRALCSAMLEVGPRRGRLFDAYTINVLKPAFRRLIAKYKAPPFDLQTLRATCATHLTCAPSIYGGSSARHSAWQLGHSVEVAERDYVGRLRDLPKTATTLEGVMQCDGLIELIVIRAWMCTARRGQAFAERDAKDLVQKAIAEANAAIHRPWR